jgi:SAM-dependent methyltransferase
MTIQIKRADLANPHLKGRGVEIGGGSTPHILERHIEVTHFDVRSREELATYFATENIDIQVHPLEDFNNIFPQGADFLIAHHVLEHTPNPIETLLNWHKMVKPDGTIVISLPNHLLCGDDKRLVPPIEHLLADYCFESDGDDFSSLEHILSFLCSWYEFSPGLQNLNAKETCDEMLSNLHRSGHDLHWHAYDHNLAFDLVNCTAALSNQEPNFLVNSKSWDDKERYDHLDMTFIYKLESGRSTIGNKIISRFRRSIESGLLKLNLD